MVRRQSRAGKAGNVSVSPTRPHRRRTRFRGFCAYSAGSVEDGHTTPRVTSPPVSPLPPPLDAVEVQPPTAAPVKPLLRRDSDLVAPSPTHGIPPLLGCRPTSLVHSNSSMEKLQGQRERRRSSPTAHHRSTNTTGNSSTNRTASQATSAPWRLSRAAPLPFAAPQPPPPHTAPAIVSPRMKASFTAMAAAPPTSDNAYPQSRPPLRALPTPHSRLLVFNTQMTNPVPMLVHGSPQHTFVNYHGSCTHAGVPSSPEHYGSPARLPGSRLPTPIAVAQNGLTSAASTPSGGASVAAPMSAALPGRRRSRVTAAVVPDSCSAAFARVPPAAPALHYGNFMLEGSQNDNTPTPRGTMAGSNTRPASIVSLTASPSPWSSTNASHDVTGSDASSMAAGGGKGDNTDLVILVPSITGSTSCSESTPSFSSMECLRYSSLVSSGSVASLTDAGPGYGGTSPVPLAERAFAPWQNNGSNSAIPPLDSRHVPLPPEAAEEGPTPTPSILMPRRGSSHSSTEATMGSTSFISARLRKSSRELEPTREIETVSDFVARMQATKRRAAGESAELSTPDSSVMSEMRAELTSSTAGLLSGGTSAGLDNSARSAGLAIAVPVPPPPPQAASRASIDSGGAGKRSQRHSSLVEAVPAPNTPICVSSPELQPTSARPFSPLATSLSDRDATSTGSGRCGSSYRRRDVRASVEAALANMSSGNAPSPSAASHRKRRDMAVNFLFAP